MNQSSVTPASPDTHSEAAPRPSWGDTLRAYLEPASLRMFALGFSAGLPLLLVLGTLSFRLREAGLECRTAVCVVDREEGGVDELARHGVRLRALFRAGEFAKSAKSAAKPHG